MKSKSSAFRSSLGLERSYTGMTPIICSPNLQQPIVFHVLQPSPCMLQRWKLLLCFAGKGLCPKAFWRALIKGRLHYNYITYDNSSHHLDNTDRQRLWVREKGKRGFCPVQGYPCHSQAIRLHVLTIEVMIQVPAYEQGLRFDVWPWCSHIRCIKYEPSERGCGQTGKNMTNRKPDGELTYSDYNIQG